MVIEALSAAPQGRAPGCPAVRPLLIVSLFVVVSSACSPDLLAKRQEAANEVARKASLSEKDALAGIAAACTTLQLHKPDVMKGADGHAAVLYSEAMALGAGSTLEATREKFKIEAVADMLCVLRAAKLRSLPMKAVGVQKYLKLGAKQNQLVLVMKLTPESAAKVSSWEEVSRDVAVEVAAHAEVVKENFEGLEIVTYSTK